MKFLYILAAIYPLFGYNQNGNNEKVNVTTNRHFPQVSNHSSMEQGRIIENYINQPITGNSNDNPVQIVKRKRSLLLDVPVIGQKPELKNGCEVTSLAMVLRYAGVETSKMELYHSIQKETDPLVRSPYGDIIRWGNPEYGFVGDMTGRQAGTTVFDKPLMLLMNQKLPGRAVNLTNLPFEEVLNHLAEGYPVVVWTTLDYGPPRRWVTWMHGQDMVRVPLDLHTVVLVGYDKDYVYLNDPLTVKKQVKVGMGQFITSWKALGSRAVSYR